MKGKIIVHDVRVSDDRIDYDYVVEGDIAKYFRKNQPMFVEYSEKITSVPKGIAMIPFLTNILPIIWLADAKVYVPEIDRAFYESIPQFKRGYESMYEDVSFKGEIVVKKVVDYGRAVSNKMAMFFSGGVDSTCTLINRLVEKPDLLTLLGADIFLDNREGLEKVKSLVLETAETFDVKPVFISSNFRLFIDEAILSREFNKMLGTGWWEGVQHGIGMIGHAAPYAFIAKIQLVYVASSIPNSVDYLVKNASVSYIDNFVKFGNTSVMQEGNEFTRTEKINRLCQFSKEMNIPLQLRVCYTSKVGDNCNVCSKCAEAILTILILGYHPNDFGYKVNADVLKQIEQSAKNEWIFERSRLERWDALQKQLRECTYPIYFRNELQWFFELPMNRFNRFMKKKWYYRKLALKIWLYERLPTSVIQQLKKIRG